MNNKLRQGYVCQRESIRLLIWMCLLFTGVTSCKKDEVPVSVDNSTTFTETPEIRLEKVSPVNVKQLQDSIVFSIYYKDGDGDLGYYQADSPSIYITDTRMGITEKFFLQPLAPANTKIKIDGYLNVVLNSTFLQNSSGNSEKVVYKVKMRDRAGHWSNEASSEEITIVR